MVSSLDGAAHADGRSAGLSSPADERVFRVLRALTDVVLVGAGTARAEAYAAVQPAETLPERRVRSGQPPTPPIAVVSRRLDLDPASALFGGPQRSIVITTADSDPGRRQRLEEVADVIVAGDDALDVGRALDALADRGLTRVLCEGGPTLLRAAAASGRLDELCLTVGPRLVAGDAGRILQGPELPGRDRLQLTQVLTEDDDLFLRYTHSGPVRSRPTGR